MTDAYGPTRENERSPLCVEGTQIFGQHDSTGRSEAQLIFADLKTLRNRIVAAWQERAIMLSSEEQRDLRDEIQRTCELLRDFVGEEASD
jgi:hypothetical protein